MRTRPPALAALLLVGVLPLTACSTAATDAPPPPGIDLDAYDAAGVPGNGLWLLDGDAAAAEIVQAARAARTVRYSGSFIELTEGAPDAEPASGRSLGVEFSGGSARRRPRSRRATWSSRSS